jgi:small subunit ribosomal protein S20
LANLKSAIKRNRQNEKRRLHNRVSRGTARNFVRDARLAIKSGDVDAAREATMKAVSALDRAASKGVIPKGRASRKISRVANFLANLGKNPVEKPAKKAVKKAVKKTAKKSKK